jgi:ribonuclease D
MNGWRYDLFGKKAEALLSGKLALSFEGGQVRLFEL